MIVAEKPLPRPKIAALIPLVIKHDNVASGIYRQVCHVPRELHRQILSKDSGRRRQLADLVRSGAKQGLSERNDFGHFGRLETADVRRMAAKRERDRSHQIRPLSGYYELIDLPRIPERRGSLTFIEGSRHVPFDIARVYYLYDVPSSATRAGHAHYNLLQLIIAMSGSFDVNLDNGFEKATLHLDRPYRGLLLRPMIWRTIDNFSGGALCLVIASIPYDEADYIRDYNEYLRICRSAK